MTTKERAPKPESALADFPRPSVAVDVAVLSVVPDADGVNRLSVLLTRRETDTHRGQWSLPGSFVRERERLSDAVTRTLRDKAGVEGLAPRQLTVLDDPDRDDRGWVLSVAHLDTVPVSNAVGLVGADASRVLWTPVGDGAGRGSSVRIPGRQQRLPFDHDRIVDTALAHVRSAYEDRPDPFGLLEEPFTILELRRLHEAVLGRELQKDTFRRTMMAGLRATTSVEAGTVGRPARRYLRKGHTL